MDSVLKYKISERGIVAPEEPETPSLVTEKGRDEKEKIEAQLDWIQLREELNEFGKKNDERDTSYKFNKYVFTGLVITGSFFIYGLANMHNKKKMLIGQFGRIASQFTVATMLAYGFYDLSRDEERLKKALPR